MATLAGITYWQLTDGSGLSSMGDDGATASERWKCLWDDRLRLATALLGGSMVGVDGGRVNYPRYQHPLYPNVYASAVSISPHGRPLGLNVWEYAILDVAFRTYPFEQGDDLVEEELDIGGQVVSAGTDWTDEADDSPVTNPVSITVPHIEYSYTQHRIPQLPLAKIAAAFNRVNDSEWNGFAAGHVLYLGCRARRVTTASGGQDWTLVHKLACGFHDFRMHFDRGKYRRVKDADGNYKYASVSFATIFG